MIITSNLLFRDNQNKKIKEINGKKNPKLFTF